LLRLLCPPATTSQSHASLNSLAHTRYFPHLVGRGLKTPAQDCGARQRQRSQHPFAGCGSPSVDLIAIIAFQNSLIGCGDSRLAPWEYQQHIILIPNW
jgi:hypothetical protein